MVFAQYVNEIGGSVSFGVEQGDAVEQRHEGRNEALLSFEDILSFDDWALEMLKYPTVAVLLLYPITKEMEEVRKKQEEEPREDQTAAETGTHLWFTRQVSKLLQLLDPPLPQLCLAHGVSHASCRSRRLCLLLLVSLSLVVHLPSPQFPSASAPHRLSLAACDLLRASIRFFPSPALHVHS